MQEYSAPSKNIYYTIECGVQRIALRIVRIQIAKLCGLRSNIDFTHYVWSTFDYHCTNYAMIVLPSHTSVSKIVHTRHIKAELGGENSRLCGNFECNKKDLHTS